MKRTTMPDRDEFSPPLLVTDDDRFVHISIGLLGVTEEQIRIDLEKTTMTVSVSKDGETLRKITRIPRGARFFKKKFSDEVLEIILEKPAA